MTYRFHRLYAQQVYGLTASQPICVTRSGSHIRISTWLYAARYLTGSTSVSDESTQRSLSVQGVEKRDSLAAREEIIPILSRDFIPIPKEEYIAPYDPASPPVTLEEHSAFIGLPGSIESLKQINLNEVKLSYLMSCRRNQRHALGQEHLAQLGQSYEIVADVVTYHKDHMETWNPGDVAMEMMHNVKEVKQIRAEALLLWNVWLGITLLLISIFVAWLSFVRQASERPEVIHHIAGDTMLPWWGNDVEYERSVKRLYLEEWRKARSAARRGQTFQEGMAREALYDESVRTKDDLSIFDVSDEHLARLRERIHVKKNL